MCDAACGSGTKFRERNCQEIDGKRTCPFAETLGREEKHCTLGPCKGMQSNNDKLKSFFTECCSKVYITAKPKGAAMQAQYNLLGDYYQMADCAQLAKREGCDADGGY